MDGGRTQDSKLCNPASEAVTGGFILTLCLGGPVMECEPQLDKSPDELPFDQVGRDKVVVSVVGSEVNEFMGV